MTAHNITIDKVLSVLLEKTQITEAHLARMLGMPRATINKIRSGKILHPTSSTLTLIAGYFNITVDQLIGSAPLFNASAIKIIHIPVIKCEDLKFSQYVFSKINFVNHDKWISLENNDEENIGSFRLFATKLKGGAMLPYFDDNTTLIIDRLSPILNRKYVLAYISKTDEILLRQIFFIENSRQILKPLNKKFAEIEVGVSDRIIGVLIQTKKQF
jgi:transcriptional regulator with XRE-family HTH domain